jgi:hypothetical protein
MTTSAAVVGVPSQGKAINLAQLQTELAAAGVVVDGLGLDAGQIYTYDAEGIPCDFATADTAAVEQCVSNHVAMRDKTSAEYAAEFQNPETTPARKQEIRDVQNGLLPPEQVPMEAPPA